MLVKKKDQELNNFNNVSNDQFKTNRVSNKFLQTGDRFMPEMYSRQPGFTYSVCRPFTKHRDRIQKFREASNLKHLKRNGLDKTCFAYDTAQSDNKDLAISGKILKDRAYEIPRNRNYDGNQREIVSLVYRFFHKKSRSGVSVNENLAKELHKPVI